MGGVTIDWSKLATGMGRGIARIGLSLISGGSVLTDLVKELQGNEAKAAAENLVAAINRERSKIHIDQTSGCQESAAGSLH